MPSIKMKWISSLEKCFWDERIENKAGKDYFLMFHNERLAMQLAYYNEQMERIGRAMDVVVEGELAPYVTLRDVVQIPSMHPAHHDEMDENYLRIEPGLYPDLLRPLQFAGGVIPAPQHLCSLFVTVKLPEDFPAGEYDLTVSFHARPGTTTPARLLGSATAKVRVLKASLPPQRLIHTEWFHTDCIASAYHTEVFSEQHWRAIESFIRVAVENGINMILAPIFTPELDTYIGGERLTTQLVDITRERDGTYTFGFEKLDRWLEICGRVGVEYFEIPAFFTQWGAKNAPKIIAKVNGEEKRIFG